LIRAAALAISAVLVATSCTFIGGPPTSVSFNLRNKQLEVPTGQQLVMTFGQPVELRLLWQHFQVSPQTAGELGSGGDGRHFTFAPAKGWLEATLFTVQVKPFHDLRGNPVNSHVWAFTTTIVPRVATFLDDGGVNLGPGDQVEQGGHVNLVFNTAMSQADTVVTSNGQPAKLTWSSDGKLAAISTAGLPVGALELALTAGKDLQNHLAVAATLIKLDVAYRVHIATRHLAFPALVQIPNDGYGARPQVGVQAASIIFEYQTEGSIQRLTALYTDVPDVIGPTRSGRRISFRLVRHYHGNLFLSGLSADAHNVLNSDPVVAWFDNPPGFFRDLSRAAPNNLMLKGDEVINREAQSGVSAFEPLKRGAVDIGPGAAATSFGVAEHRSTYTYDPVTGTYGKVEDGETMTDASLGKPDQLFMVLVLHTREFLVADIESGCCTHGRDFDLDSGGALDIYYRGQVVTGSWSAADRTSPLVFKNAAGQEINLPNGLVWVDVVGN
jgi:Protein of unknown function (DUF3048) N-terminal domain/Protein of unknown function (DUF3048) C-terminal domain/Bacterial Ig-like domain